MLNLQGFTIILLLLNASISSSVSEELQECDAINNKTIENNQNEFSCKTSISGDTTITINLDISKALQADSISNIPVITTSPEIESAKINNGNQLSIMVISSKADALFTNYIEQQGDRTVSTPLYFPQFLKQNASKPFQKLELRMSSTYGNKISFTIHVNFTNIGINLKQEKEAIITKIMPAVWTFKNDDPKFRRLRVHTTSKHDIGCSIVAVQHLNRDIYVKEADVTFESRWQTMLNQSVIDIDVGDGSLFVDGFVVVVVMKATEKDCICNDYDFRFDGRYEYFSSGHCSGANTTEIEEHVRNISTKAIRIKIEEIDTSYTDFISTRNWSTGIVLGTYVGLCFMIILVALLDYLDIIYVPIAGNVLLNVKETSIYNVGGHELGGYVYEQTGNLLGMIGINTLCSCLRGGLEKCMETCKINSVCNRCWIYCFPDPKDTTDSSGGEVVGYYIKPILSVRRNTLRRTRSEPATVQNPQLKVEICKTSSGKGNGVQNMVDTEDTDLNILPQPASGSMESSLAKSTNGLSRISEDTVDNAHAPLQEEDNKDDSNAITSIESVSIESECQCLLDSGNAKVHRLLSRDELIAGRRTQDLRMNRMTSTFSSDMYSDRRRMKSRMYPYILALMGICYALPAGQLMLVAQHVSEETGTEDICFYNYLCRYNVDWLDDYGHVFSNVSYEFCGIFFMIIVFTRQHKRRKMMIKKAQKKDFTKENVEHLNEIGIPEQYGLFYAMGVALILEGILSSAYHLCPVNESFQFDTTFMYIISALIYSKVYQFRHPDIAPKAYVLFIVIAIMLIFEVIGYYAPAGPAFMVVFLLTYLAFISIFYQKMYFQGDRNIDLKIRTGCRSKRLFFVLVTLFNIGLAIFFLTHAWYKTSVISKYLLVIFGSNMAIYVFFYLAMKYYYALEEKHKNESLTCITWAYFVLGLACSFVGIYYFKEMERDSRRSPAMSRQLNQECTFGIFDKHDIWHFTSSAGLFFTFMTVLTMEDNNTNQERQQIPVF